ncbi:enolase C-terminal domain-like protein [Paraburkholderia hospita]|uniref:Mandelate racemase n=1 Tax=Paraburkholderia hospita TaxID=169430 RepID=A0AAN1JJC1_9BURK|nr:enolase C-terminal domain-like protein [Paraburkholderia hospita]AUT75080.1 mandelate racemase [Paraburkholderia hospita]EIM93268.1 putative mandelate racemase (MdlA) [Paraburkholderia hospita]OUL87246.1 mandelate racemase [Paraburkholderia hospita]OUL89832.1 mandelate racemase [Paraburkholderia hospita]SEH84888.1 mandelate racemase [Paraburkholderia hospita]
MNDIRITDLRARAVNVPLHYPIRTAVGTVDTAPLVLIDLITNASVTGCAYLFTYTPLALKPVQRMVEELAVLIRGMPVAPYEIDRLMQSKFRLIGHTGLLRMATAGIDMAAWDAKAKLHDVPLVTLLGGTARPIAAYDSHGMDDVELAQKRAHDAVEAGFKAIKTKIGYPTLDHDVKVVRAIREVVGDNVQIMVDYNQGLTVPEAMRRGRVIEQEGVAWIEEPTLQHDHTGHAAIRDALHAPVQMGENWFGPEDMTKAIAAGACDLCMPDIMKIGGVTGWLRASALAEQHGLPMSSHIFQEFSAHLLAVSPTCHWLERMDVAAPILEPVLSFKDGMAHFGDVPGAGIVWKEDEVKRFLV